ncbi:hypothetical protein BOX24_05055 [Leptospirillum ferriphilum]|uniref:Uncharacterized protein n=1 Tax=Leptospirillum ferriphilum TaxID=178606 RepID=A0A1V3SW86_9BACT|nr:hypothetical protein BOX24_05055 [Leptospirillum ferriphilum]
MYSAHTRHEEAEGKGRINRGTKKSADLSGRSPPLKVFLAPGSNLASCKKVVNGGLSIKEKVSHAKLFPTIRSFSPQMGFTLTEK